MSKIKGAKEYDKFKRGESLTRKQAMTAQCYACNGFEDSRADCLGKSCPMYQYRLHKGVKSSEREEVGETYAQDQQ